MINEINIGNWNSTKNSTFIIAELSANHKHDFSIALFCGRLDSGRTSGHHCLCIGSSHVDC